MSIIQHADLFFQEGNSDKEYHLQLIETPRILSGYSVTFQYGRRGSALNDGSKITGVPFEAAQKVYNKVLNEKLGKGYQLSSSPSIPVRPPQRSLPNLEDIRTTTTPVTTQAAPSSFTSIPPRKINWMGNQGDTPEVSLETQRDGVIFIPQLLNVIEEEDIETYLRDDRYGAQEKKDGRHQPFHKKAGEVFVTNKKGKAIGFPEALKNAILTSQDLLVDAEIIGDTFHAFDLLEVCGVDQRGLGYQQRYEALKSLFSIGTFDSQHIRLVPLAVGYQAKKALYDKLKKEKREGMVFKLLDAPYTPGKAHTAMWKVKFYAELSARVCTGREGKRSVGVELLDGSVWKFMGNVTIPPNKEVPSINQVIEVRYLYVDGPGGSLYQPFYKEPRDDVDPVECLMSQVKYKPKED
jgi:bifunctional non-homologous end joining protein LigD